MMEYIIDKDLDSIFDVVDTGHRHDGCCYKDIENYFKYFIMIAQKYKIYNYDILNFIEDIKKELSLKSFGRSFFILDICGIYEKELKKLIMVNVNKLDEFVVKHLKQIKKNNEMYSTVK